MPVQYTIWRLSVDFEHKDVKADGSPQRSVPNGPALAERHQHGYYLRGLARGSKLIGLVHPQLSESDVIRRIKGTDQLKWRCLHIDLKLKEEMLVAITS